MLFLINRRDFSNLFIFYIYNAAKIGNSVEKSKIICLFQVKLLSLSLKNKGYL